MRLLREPLLTRNLHADTWAIADDWAGYPTSGNGTAQCRLNRWAAMETDQRFPAVLAELVKHGFKPGDQTKPGWLGLAMRNTRDQVDKGTFFCIGNSSLFP